MLKAKNYEGTIAEQTYCKFCGRQVNWVRKHNKNVSYELGGAQHLCEKYGGNLKVYRIDKDALEKEYGKKRPSRRFGASKEL